MRHLLEEEAESHHGRLPDQRDQQIIEGLRMTGMFHLYLRGTFTLFKTLLIFTKILTNISSLLCRSVDFDETPVGGGRKSPWEPPGSKRATDIGRGSSPYDR